jgi:hypothetical protein
LQSFFIKGCFFFCQISQESLQQLVLPVFGPPRSQSSWGIVTIGMNKDADVAQLVEQLTCNQLVGGSNPSIGSEKVL